MSNFFADDQKNRFNEKVFKQKPHINKAQKATLVKLTKVQIFQKEARKPEKGGTF